MYLVLEIQKFSESQVAVPTPIFSNIDENQAQSEFHRLCSVAAVSTVPCHTILLIEDNGMLCEVKSYQH